MYYGSLLLVHTHKLLTLSSGWCLTTGSCVRQGQCPSNSSITSTPRIHSTSCSLLYLVVTLSSQCPQLQSFSPNTGSTNGGTLVSITANYFLPNADTMCVFGTTLVPLQSFNTTQITCVTPPGYAVAVNVSVAYPRLMNMYVYHLRYLSSVLYGFSGSLFTYYGTKVGCDKSIVVRYSC